MLSASSARRAVSPGDAGLAVGLGVISLAGTRFAALGQPQARPIDALGAVLLLVGPAALLARRHRPVVVLAVAAAAMEAYVALRYPDGPGWLAVVVALVSAVALGHRWSSVAIAVACAAAGVALSAAVDPGFGLGWGIALLAAWLTALFAAGELWRARGERRVQARATRAEIARRQGSDERVRIARELHDLLGHHVSLINVQAGVALHLMDDDPEQARTALAAIKQSSRDLLRDMRSTLGVLRGVDAAPPHHPVAGLARLDDLVADARAAGLPVEVEVVGATRALPAPVDLAAYRIVQEALTNTRKHAGPARVSVRVDYEPDAISIRVDDDGVGCNGEHDGGDGLPGMRERAAALGGVLDVGTRPGGGFSVRARLPTEDAT